jgi:hypothetical protein
MLFDLFGHKIIRRQTFKTSNLVTLTLKYEIENQQIHTHASKSLGSYFHILFDTFGHIVTRV